MEAEVMRVPFGKKALVGIGAAFAGALVFLRLRSRRRDQEREWESEISGAVDEGRSGAESARSNATSEISG
jgi:hypothetical protein